MEEVASGYVLARAQEILLKVRDSWALHCKGERWKTRESISASGECVSWGGVIRTINKSSSRRVSTKWTRPLETAPGDWRAVHHRGTRLLPG